MIAPMTRAEYLLDLRLDARASREPRVGGEGATAQISYAEDAGKMMKLLGQRTSVLEKRSDRSEGKDKSDGVGRGEAFPVQQRYVADVTEEVIVVEDDEVDENQWQEKRRHVHT